MTLDTFGDLKNRVAVRVGASRAADVSRVGEYCIEAVRDFWRRHDWPERRRQVALQVPAAVEFTATVTNGSVDVSAPSVPFVTGTWPASQVSWQILIGGWGTPPYEITEVTDADNVKVARPYLGEDKVGIDCVIYQDRLWLPPECAEVLTEDIHLLEDKGRAMRWKDRLTGNWEYTDPVTSGRPRWLTFGDHYIDPTTGRHNRCVRVGPSAGDVAYAIQLGFKNTYPGGTEDADPLLIPVDRRDIVMWGALMRAYSEPPWLNEVDALQMKQLYEAETGIAESTEQEGDSEMFQMDMYDSGSYW